MFGRANIRLGIGPHSSFVLFSSPNLIGRRLDVYHTFTHSVTLVRIQNAGLKMCCTWLAENTGRRNSPSGHHCTTSSDYVFATKAHIENRKKNLLNSNISPTCPYNMVNFGPLTAEICWRVCGTPVNFNGFRVFGSVTARQSSSGRQPNCGVEQRAPPIFGRAAITLGIRPHF